MSVDLLGPASLNAVTVRPTRSIARGAANTWFKDCSSPVLKDGTMFGADFFNDLLANARGMITGAGIVQDNADDMLWRAVLAASVRYAVAGGSANALAATFYPPIGALVDGMCVLVKITTTNTGACTFDAGPGPVPVQHFDGSALAAGDLVAGQLALLGTVGAIWQLINPAVAGGGGGGGSAAAGITGQVVLTTGNAPLAGTLKLNGQLIDRTAYAGLWTFAQASGRICNDTQWSNSANNKWTSFSEGDGSTTFRLPDLRGEFLRMWDDSRGVDAGRDIGIAQAMMVQNHAHTGAISVTGIDLQAYTNPPASIDTSGGGGPLQVCPATEVTTLTGTLSMESSGGGAETRPRNAALLACIVY